LAGVVKRVLEELWRGVLSDVRTGEHKQGQGAKTKKKDGKMQSKGKANSWSGSSGKENISWAKREAARKRTQPNKDLVLVGKLTGRRGCRPEIRIAVGEEEKRTSAVSP